MSIVEMAAVVNRNGFLKVDSLALPVHVRDIRKVFQRVDVLVTPIGGNGEQWVSFDRVQMFD